MKHIYNLFSLSVFLLCLSNSKADQLTITFTNPVPAAPVNCGDSWSEQGIEMTVVQTWSDCNGSVLDYGNGNLTLYFAKLIVDLSSLGNINSISASILTGCHDEVNIISDNEILENETILGSQQTFFLYEFNNENSAVIESLEIINVECLGAVLFDITIDYTPACESTPISNVRNGDVYLNDACYGVIMTSPSGNCFRAKVADNGMLFTEPVECP